MAANAQTNHVAESQPETKVNPAVSQAGMINPKYGEGISNRPSGVSTFLQKRLQKGQKFFDSGDYNVARSMRKPPSTEQGGSSNNPTGSPQRNMSLLLPPTVENNPPVLTPEDLPQHPHAHETSKLVTDQVHPTA